MKIAFHVVALLGVAVIAFVLGQMYQPPATQDMFGDLSRDRDATSGSQFNLTSEQIRDAIESANGGSKEAARKLYFYYAFHESNDAEAMKWQLVLADMGDAVSQHALMNSYLTAEDLATRREGIERCTAWLEQDARIAPR